MHLDLGASFAPSTGQRRLSLLWFERRRNLRHTAKSMRGTAVLLLHSLLTSFSRYLRLHLCFLEADLSFGLVDALLQS